MLHAERVARYLANAQVSPALNAGIAGVVAGTAGVLRSADELHLVRPQCEASSLIPLRSSLPVCLLKHSFKSTFLQVEGKEMTVVD